jgi:hypothetical protein
LSFPESPHWSAVSRSGTHCLPTCDCGRTQHRSSQRAEKKSFTDSQIIDGFLKTAFGAEYHLAGRVDRIRKYQMPVRVFVDGSIRADRHKQIGKVVRDIAARIQHLDIAVANSAITPISLSRWCATAIFRKPSHLSTDRRRPRKSMTHWIRSACPDSAERELRNPGSDVILTVDNGDFVFLDCAYEELLQSLGPINDTDTVPWTMFNDQVSMGYFGVYDQYILNILYDPRKAGMTVDEVRAVLPSVLPDVRAWVAKINDLPK